MYNVIFAVKSRLLLQELNHMHIWGDSTGFRIRKITDDFGHLIAELKKTKYHLLLLEVLPDNQAISLLKTIKKENLCRAVAVVSETADFKTVRKSFLLGADDYFVIPLEISQFITLFSRIENAEHGRIAAEICEKEELIHLFEQADFSIKGRLDELLYRVLTEFCDVKEAVGYLERIIDGVAAELFERHEWLEYYFDAADASSNGCGVLEEEEKARRYLEDFNSFFEEFAELYPPHGEGLEEILLYILNRPEGDLRQKTISEELYINRSYLSTVFTAQMGINFVDYVNTVKMKRAAYLLRHTKMKIIDIAGALDYKDMGYFLKRFKARYGVTPSQYRIPENYEFQI
ncbi:MAG: helix-turn-helix domain-containing protein [Lachnospiraceae bacterium]|nr:helix-turn-helix domain-containing protein [Lachnospiraceae bacterium]